MTTEQIIALIGSIVGLPIFIEIAKRWFESRNMRLQSNAEEEKTHDEREWKALEDALERERKIYADFIATQRTEFSERLSNVEAQLAKIQEVAAQYQREYWQERIQRELLQTRVASLEQELRELKGQHDHE